MQVAEGEKMPYVGEYAGPDPDKMIPSGGDGVDGTVSLPSCRDLVLPQEPLSALEKKSERSRSPSPDLGIDFGLLPDTPAGEIAKSQINVSKDVGRRLRDRW